MATIKSIADKLRASGLPSDLVALLIEITRGARAVREAEALANERTALAGVARQRAEDAAAAALRAQAATESLVGSVDLGGLDARFTAVAQRSSHSGVQPISSVTGLAAALDDFSLRIATVESTPAPPSEDLGALVAALDALTIRVTALEAGQPPVTPTDPEEPLPAGRIEQLTGSYGGRVNVTPSTYYQGGAADAAAMHPMTM